MTTQTVGAAKASAPGLLADAHRARLRAIAQHISRGSNEDAERELTGLLSDVERRGDPDAVGCYVFGAALAARLSPKVADEANLYLHGFEVPQIHLFNLLANEVPQVGLTTVIANRCLTRAIAGQEYPTVIDVGIGTGRQMTMLLESMKRSAAEGGSLPKRLTMVGIEPADWSLDLAEQNVRRSAADLGIELSFERFCNVAEGLDKEDWSRLATLCSSRPAINASFALHHVSDVEGRDVRDDILLRLRSLDPRALVLSEPNVHHLEADFLRRFEHCLHHFGVTFSVIDRLDIPKRDQDALKVCFFGREIVDILGRADDVRTERHESTASWRARLARTGFSLGMDVELPPSGPVIRVCERDGCASLEFEQETLVSVLCAAPTSGAHDVEGALARAPSTSPRRSGVKPIDIAFYLTALSAVARADGVVHESERRFIDAQARIFGVARGQWENGSLDDVLARAESVDRGTKEAIVRDLVFLARVDDHYDDTERSAIAAIAQGLGFSRDDLARLEAKEAVPPVLSGAPSWVRQLWFLGSA